MLAESLAALAALAGQTVVAAASTDAWEACKNRFARLLGHGDPKREQLAEQRLEETRRQLAGSGSEQARAAQEAQWATRLADLLEEHPDAEADLRALVREAQGLMLGGVASATGHALAAGRDVKISASGGGVAAGVIHGNVAPPDPTRPGQEDR